MSPDSRAREKVKGFRVGEGDQMEKIIDLIGKPDELQKSFISDSKAKKYVGIFESTRDLASELPEATPEAVDLLKSLL